MAIDIEASAGVPGPPVVEDSFAHEGKVRIMIVTPERAVLDEAADFVVLPMFDGELGVLPKRAPLVGRLGPGEIRIKNGETVTGRYFIEGGFAQVRSDTVTVLTPNARPSVEITPAVAEQSLRDAEGLPAETVGQRESRSRAMEVAIAMGRVNKPSGPTSDH